MGVERSEIVEIRKHTGGEGCQLVVIKIKEENEGENEGGREEEGEKGIREKANCQDLQKHLKEGMIDCCIPKNKRD